MTVIVVGLIQFAAWGSPTFNTDHWHRVLQQYVDNKGFVDYAGLSENRQDLDRFLDQVKTSGPTLTPQIFPNRQEELAYYINAYNALVFEGVLARGPEKKSVWSGLISGLNFFVRMDVELDGTSTNLRNLENDIIRAKYGDPRIHAALNCASISCPRLPRIPFSGANLDRELDDAMTEFIGSENNVFVDNELNKVFLNEIFDWFEDDFTDYEASQGSTSPNIIDYINRFRPADMLIDPGYKVDYIEYDKGINSQ